MSTRGKQLLPSGKMGGIFFEYYMNKGHLSSLRTINIIL
ncbi:hypothetical protein N786_06120 [Bacillus amyloliquefaciens UASWS BA1]|nr:hypothetical protein N786_06120 [Bacillus amyloliquefaciens UASWS BA1]